MREREKLKKSLGACKPKDLSRITEIGYGHLCLKEIDLSFSK